MILLLLYLVKYTIVPLVEAALDVEGSHPRPWQGTRCGAVRGGKEDTAIGRYALSVTLIVTVSQPGVANVTGTRRSVRYLYTTLISTYLHISTHSDLSDISVITQPSPPRQLPDIVLIIRILLCVLNF